MTELQESSDSASAKIFVDFDLSPSYTPLLIFRNLRDDSVSTINLEYGKTLVWKTGESRYCVGYHVKDEYHHYEPCPSKSMVEKGIQCSKCKNKDLLFPCMICNGSECVNIKSMWNVCEVTPTSVYITFFGDMIKVGVSKKDRLLKRWIEQGADYASEIAVAPNGLIAREIESAVSKEFEVTKGVRIQKKLKSISIQNERLFEDTTNPEQSIKKEYNNRVKTIAEWIMHKYGETLAVKEPIIRDLQQFSGLAFKGSVSRLNSIDDLHGHFAGMKGALFFLEMQNRLCVFDIRELRGKISEIEIASDHNNAVSITSQRSITDFFG